jgi:hypothetical protein
LLSRRAEPGLDDQITDATIRALRRRQPGTAAGTPIASARAPVHTTAWHPRLSLPHVSQEILDEVRAVAHALAYIIVTDRRFTDLYRWGQRSTPLTLAAEVPSRALHRRHAGTASRVRRPARPWSAKPPPNIPARPCGIGACF